MDPLKIVMGTVMIAGGLLSVPTRTRRIGHVVILVAGFVILFLLP